MAAEIVYSVIETELDSEYAGKYTGYGIAVKMKTEQGEQVLRLVEDISEVRGFTENLAYLMNNGCLAAEHVDDVLHDMLGIYDGS